MKKTPFSSKELNEYKDLLEEKKARIIKDIQEQAAELKEEKDNSGDLVDQATNVLERDINLSLTHAEQEIVEEIDEALERIKDKTYGVCIDTDTVIAKARLKAMPEAKRTTQAQEKHQKMISKQRNRGKR